MCVHTHTRLVPLLAGYHKRTFTTYQANMKGTEENLLSHNLIFVRVAERGQTGRKRDLPLKGASRFGMKFDTIPHKLNHNPALAAISHFVLLLLLFFHTAREPEGQTARPYHSSALPHTGITTPLSHLQQPATASCLSVLQATLLITYSLSVTVHLCL